jgi:hypothetical protein
MALDLEPWFLQAIDKLRCGFLWAGASEERRLLCRCVGPGLSAQGAGGLGLPQPTPPQHGSAEEVVVVLENGWRQALERHGRRR